MQTDTAPAPYCLLPRQLLADLRDSPLALGSYLPALRVGRDLVDTGLGQPWPHLRHAATIARYLETRALAHRRGCLRANPGRP